MRDLRQRLHGRFINFLHVLGWEVAKRRVLRLRKHFVVGEFPFFASCHGEELLHMILYDHRGSMVDCFELGLGLRVLHLNNLNIHNILKMCAGLFS